MKWTSVLALSIAITLLSGCSSIVSQQILYPYSERVEVEGASYEQLLEEHNLEFKLANSSQGNAIPYLFGDSSKLDEDYLIPKLEVSFTLTNTSSGEKRLYELEFTGKNQSPPERKNNNGLVVLLHAYSATQKQLFFDSTAWQLKGYDTIVVELLGHGSSTDGPISFGPKDIERIHTIIEEYSLNNEQRLILYGKSYGASIAAQYIQKYEGVDAFVAVAPMTSFTSAAMNFHKRYHSGLIKLIPEGWLHDNIEKTLVDSNVTSESIATPSILKTLPKNRQVPTLILSGQNDVVSDFNEIDSATSLPNVTLKMLPERFHLLMMAYDDVMDKDINDWLNTHF
ncbi:alpha/beta hydrolase [Idiomarina ramblicola]|uniref:Serine aminopeptidase S33 domain-containing protein n=1 Tax=Idiomarina ramblicola TaxID=263724 RepID=A0A432Z5M5_9GAMM|nr:alpha/beta fold hydrolase [Idiomarina ramblicola]RUO73190.1 hypothetical protein CWI78_01745 [Idiomarina ramblicola]